MKASATPPTLPEVQVNVSTVPAEELPVRQVHAWRRTIDRLLAPVVAPKETPVAASLSQGGAATGGSLTQG